MNSFVATVSRSLSTLSTFRLPGKLFPYERVQSFDAMFARPAEASRAVRKKLKHGNAHQQYRALVVSVCQTNGQDAIDCLSRF